MSIEDRNVKVGTVLVKRYKKRDYRCEVVKGEDGKVAYKVGGKEYGSPSAAGSAVMGGTACNGWKWWNVEGTEKPTKAKAATKATKATTKPKTGGKGTKRTTRANPVAGGANGEPVEDPAPVEEPIVEKPVNCGDCGLEFPTGREAADHMREAHSHPEAAGSGGR